MIKQRNKNIVFIDTSGWVALFTKTDKNHSKAVSVFDEIKLTKWEIYTTDYVLDETITFISQKINFKASLEIGNAFLTNKIAEIVFIDRENFTSAWEFYKKFDDKNFSFTDVVSFRIMKNLEIRKALSFDHHFEQAGFELI